MDSGPDGTAGTVSLAQVKKRSFEPFICKNDDLPRQARDKHREENSKNRLAQLNELAALVDADGDGTITIWEFCGAKTPLFAPFIYKNDHFTKTGSGQT
eukprot:COSAG06_NODE_1032_length_11010_cov_13.156448_3_plen_99_part_00